MQYNESFIKGSITKALVKFAVPLMLANLLQIFYSTVDLYIVGKYGVTADISAVSTASMIMTAVTLAITGFTTGVTVLVGQYAGAKKPDEISKTVGTSFFFFFIIAAAVTVPMLIFNKPLVSCLNAPAEAVEKTQSYMFICSIGIIFIVGYNLVVSIMRGMGNSKAPFLFVAVSSVVNVITDYILVRFFSMGATGAAIATVCSQCVSFVFSLIYLFVKGTGFELKKTDIRLTASYSKKIAKIGAPISLQEFLVNLSFVFVTAVINGLGLGASAAAGICEKILIFVCMPIMAFSSSVAAMSANNIGAGQPERAEKCMWRGVLICLCITVIFNFVTFFKGDLLVSIFSNDPEVIENGRLYIKSYGTDQIMLSFIFIMNGYFNACGHSVFTMAHSLITTFLLRVPLTFIFSKIAEKTLLYIGMAAPISSLASIILCMIFLIYQRKKSEKETIPNL